MFAEIILLHKAAIDQLLVYWPVAIFLFFGEIILILKSRQFTRRGGVEATISTLIPFLILAWGFSVAPESTTNRAKDVPGFAMSVWIPVLLSVGGVLVRATILQIFFETRTVWQYIASAPVPLFVYFTAWFALK